MSLIFLGWVIHPELVLFMVMADVREGKALHTNTRTASCSPSTHWPKHVTWPCSGSVGREATYPKREREESEYLLSCFHLIINVD